MMNDNRRLLAMERKQQVDTYFVHLSADAKQEIKRLKAAYGYRSQGAFILDCIRCLDAVLKGTAPPQLPSKRSSECDKL
jgi:hypothetical protein